MSGRVPPSSQDGGELAARLEALGSTLGQREAAFRGELAQARDCAQRLRCCVADALARFHTAAAAAGAPHLRIELSELRADDKHLRAVEFDLLRGRHKAIVTAKARGEVTLVGPFHIGKNEGPCLSFPLDAESELREALAGFLERFVEEAATP